MSLLGGWDAYYRYHHLLFHNVGSLLAVAVLLGLFFWRRPWVWLLVTFSFGMHVLEDYFTVPWDMMPWRPFANTVVNLGQHVPGWVVQYGFQSVAMVGIVAVTVWIYTRYKRTPLEIISPAFDRLILNYAVLPVGNRCSSCGANAHFRCDQCGRTFCANHSKVKRNCQAVCSECAVWAPSSPAGIGPVTFIAKTKGKMFTP